MKYIKKFENLTIPKIGDYILTKYNVDDYKDSIPEIYVFLNNNIGKIIDKPNNNIHNIYIVQYENIPKSILYNFNYEKNSFNDKQYENYRIVNLNNILHFSENKFDINIFKNANKFNL